MVRNQTCITLMPLAGNAIFAREFLYFRFETVSGCRANLKAVFPKQDNLDKKLRENENSGKPTAQQ